MSRAVVVIAVAVAACFLPASAHAVGVDRAGDLIDAVALVDYGAEPNFTVGSWVKYRTVGSSLQGFNDDYTVTILVAGEEVFWGDPCFWLETWTERPGETSRAVATLISYSAFGDTMAIRHPQWFMRKTIYGLQGEDKPEIMLAGRQPAEFRVRRAAWDSDDNTNIKLDTLATRTVTLPLGAFVTLPVVHARTHSETVEHGDSTIYFDRVQKQTFFMNRDVPITGFVQIETDDVQRGKSWRAGEFIPGTPNLLEQATGTTTLVDRGQGGLTPELVPKDMRRPIADRQEVRQNYSFPPEHAGRTRAPGTSERQ
jgi:hypothetical protein